MVAAFLLAVGQLNAAHIAGGDIRYECLGGDEYLVTLSLYRDCSESNLLANQFIKFNSDCGTFFNVSAGLTYTDEVSQLCPTALANSSCSGGFWPGMEIYQYEAVVTLPPCDSWEIFWELCTRTPTVNVDDTGFPCYRINARLNNADAPCNNSPVITEQNIPYVCVNQQVNYNMGVQEFDGDSLRFYLVSALTFGGGPVPYEAGFSGIAPVPGATLGPNTGQLSFTATNTGLYTFVIEVEEFNDAGVLIGTIRKDFIFVVENCPQPVPQPGAGGFSQFTGTGTLVDGNIIQVCGGDNFCAAVEFSSVNPASIITLTSQVESVLPGATFTVTGTNPAVAEVCWTVPAGFSNSYSVNIVAQDDACPVFGVAYWGFVVTPTIGVYGGPDMVICEGESVQLQATGDTDYIWQAFTGEPIIEGVNFSCTNCSDPIASPTQTTVYLVTGLNDASACINTDTVVVAMALEDMFVQVASETCFLNDASIVLNIPYGSGDYSYLWETGDTSPNLLNIPAGDYDISVTDNILGCSIDTTISIDFPPFPATYAGPDEFSCAPIYQLQADSIAETGYWIAPSGSNTTFVTSFYNANAVIVVATYGEWDFVWYEDDGNNCLGTDTVTITVAPPPEIEAGEDSGICGLTYTLEALPTPFGEPYWTSSPGVVFDPDPLDPEATVTVPDYGLYWFYWNLDLPNECGGVDSVGIFFGEPLVADAGLPVDTVCGYEYLLSGVPAGTTFSWSGIPPGLSFDPSANVADAIVMAPDSGTYELVWHVADDWCEASDTLQLTFIDPPLADAGVNDTICGLQYTLNALPSFGTGFWSSASPATFDPGPADPEATVTVADYGTHAFIWQEDNGFTCQDADTVVVLFVEQPVALAGPDSVFCGLTADLSLPGLAAQPSAGAGTWSSVPDLSFSDDSDPAPFLTAASEGTYILTWTEDNGSGCVSSDTREITFWEIPQVEAGADQQVCGSEVQLEATVLFGNPQWTAPGAFVFSPDDATPAATAVAPDFGTYTLVIASDNNGCQSSDSLQVTFVEIPVANPGTDTATCGLSYALNAVPSAGSGFWSAPPGFSFIPDNTSPTATVVSGSYGAAVFTWHENNAGCADSAQIEITFVELPVAEPGLDQSVCGLEAVLQANPSVGNGLWYSNSSAVITAGAGGQADVSVPSAGVVEFWWVENNGFGCSDSANVLVTFTEIPVANAGLNDSICGLEYSLMATPSAGVGSWLSLDPGAVIADPSDPFSEIEVADYGVYTLVWTEDNGNGCIDSDQVILVFSETPQPFAGDDAEICGLSYQLDAESAQGSAIWSGTGGVFSDPQSATSEVTVAAPGTYTFTWTDTNGNCSASDELQVSFVTLPALDAGQDDVTCGLNYTLQAVSATGAGQWSVPAGLTISDENNPGAEVTATTPGTYTLYWTETSGPCADSASVTITLVTEPEAFAGDDIAVCGLSYTLQATGNVPTGSWLPVPGLVFSDPSDPEATVTATDYGDYTLTWQLTAGVSCSDQDEVVISFVEAPVADAGENTAVCGLSASLNAVLVSQQGSWSGPPGVVFTEPSNPQSGVSADAFGTYLLTWTEITSFGCSTSDEIEITFSEQPVANAGNDMISCGFELELSATPSAGAGSWSGSGGITFVPDNSQPDASAVVLTGGTYTLIWTEENQNCISLDSISVEFIEAPQAFAGADDEVCGLTFNLQASGSGGFWTGPPGATFFPDESAPNATVTVPDYGTYAFTWNLNNGINCTDSDEVNISFFGTPSAENISVTCVDGNINYVVSFIITGGEPGSYSVTGDSGQLTGNVFTSDPIANGGTYSFELQDANGCQVINVSGSNVCPNLTFAGTMAQQPLTICGNGPVNAAHNADHTLDGNDALSFILHSNPSLPLGTVYASSQFPEFSFQPGMVYGTTYFISAIVGNDDGSGLADLSDPLLSVSTGTPVVFYQVPSATISGGGTGCEGDTIWVNADFSGIGPFTLTYSLNGQAQTPIVSAGGSVQIPVTFTAQLLPLQVSTDFCAGPVNGVANVQIAPVPEAVISGGGSVCEGGSETVTVELSGASPYTFIYAIDNNPQPAVQTGANIYSFEADQEGVYTLINVEDQLCQGETSGSASLEVTPLPIADAGDDQEVCFGQEPLVLGSPPQDGYLYQWSNTQNLSNPNIANPEVVYDQPLVVPVELSFTLTVFQNGCASEDQLNITLLPVPEIQTNSQVSMCVGGAAQLQVSGATEIDWQPNDFVADPSAPVTWVYPPDDQLYTVSVSNDFGCETVGEVFVTVHPMPDVQFTVENDAVCAPALISFYNLTAPEFTNFCTWNFGNGQVISSCNEQINAYYENQGSYNVSLTVTSPEGCSATVTEYGFVNTIGPEADFSYSPDPPDISNSRVQFINESNNAVAYFWDMGELGSFQEMNPAIDFPSAVPGIFEVCLTAIDEDGCFDQHCEEISVEADLLVYIPNAFSPNGDGINDLFYPVMEGVDIVEFEFSIFNRRGKLVWQTSDPESKWDGSDSSREYYDDNQVYVWVLKIKDRYSTLREEQSGTVMVIR